jgi:hypothetical protein
MVIGNCEGLDTGKRNLVPYWPSATLSPKSSEYGPGPARDYQLKTLWRRARSGERKPRQIAIYLMNLLDRPVFTKLTA